MPPDIMAGLIALTGPPGAAGTGKAAEAPASRTGSAAVFAALLTQSSPPDLKLAAPKTDAAPTVKLGFAAKQQTSKNPKTLSILKTMDTLPPLSFPSAGTAMKASELPFLNAPFLNAPPHKASAEDSTTNAAKVPATTPGAAASVPNSPSNAVPVPSHVPAAPITVLIPAAFLSVAPSQAVLPPASAPAPAVPAAPASAPSAAHEIQNAALPVPTVAAAVPPVPLIVSAPAPLLVVPQFVAAVQPAADSSAVPSGVSLPHTWTLPALISAEKSSLIEKLPLAFSQSAPPVTLLAAAVSKSAQPEPVEYAAGCAPAAALPAVSPAAQSARPAPPVAARAAAQEQAPLQAQAAPQVTTVSQAQTAPQGAALPLIPNPASLILRLAPPSAVFLTAASVLAEPAAGPATLPSAKSAGKFGQTALKPALQNADTNTGTLPVKAPAAAGKTAMPAAVPVKTTAPALDSRSQTLESSQAPSGKKPLAADSIPASGTPPPAHSMPLEAQGASLGGKPLSAADHAALVHQVADGVGAMPLPAKPGGVQQMSLQLHPKDWGSLQVSVSVTPGQEPGAAKVVTAHFVAETPQVKAALQSQTGALHQALRASGLSLEHLTVSVKPASETVRPAAQSVSSGFSGGQGQQSIGTSQAHSPQTTSSGQSPGTQFGTSAGSSQSGRQGQPPASTPRTAQAEAAQEEIVPVRQTVRLSGRIDTHA